MNRPFLVDTSAWAQRPHHPDARRRLDDLVLAGDAATCLPVTLELLYQVRNAAEFDAQREALGQLRWLEAGPDTEAATIDLMRRMAGKGQHRTPVPDLMIAAVAEAHHATILHYDSDFERIAKVTEQPHEWIVPRGSGHGRQR